MPVAFEYPGRIIGCGNRVEVQVLRGVKYSLRALTAFSPSYSPRLEQAMFKIEKRIGLLQKGISQVEEIYKEAFENAPIGFHRLHPDIALKGKIMDVNTEWLRILNRTREEVIGKLIFDFIVPEQQENAWARFVARLRGEIPPPKEGDRQYLQPDGTRVYVETRDRIVKDRDGVPIFVQTSFFDVTELRETERERAELEATLDIFRGIADYLSQELTSLIYCADLETSGFNNLKKTYRSVNFGAVEESLVRIKSVGDSLVKTIDLLEEFGRAAKASNNPLEEMASANIPDVLKEGLMQIGQGSKKISFNGDVSLPEIPTHKVWLGKALIYFIQNALEAINKRDEKSSGHVDLNVESDPSAIVIRISDNGKRDDRLTLDILRQPPLTHGITYAYIEYLKLAIALKYIDALGGKCEIESDKDLGTTFTISLPMENPKG